MKVEINVPDLLCNAWLRANLFQTFGVPAVAGAAAGAAAASIKFDLGLSRGYMDMPVGLRDYACVHRIETELG